MNGFRIVFMGTPDFAVGSLDALVKAGFEIAGVVTTPDRQAGRGRKLQESAVKAYAKTLNVPILQPEKLRDENFLKELADLKADLNVVVAFRMLPEVVWSMPPKGTINLHGSLLPQYRGAAPINWAIINGDAKTGVTTFFIDKKIDTGDMIDKREVEILEEDTAGTVHDKLMEVGANLLAETVGKIASGKVVSKQQAAEIENEAELRHAPKIFKDDCKIDWNKSSKEIYNFVRGLSPYPAAWTTWKKTSGETLSMKLFFVEKEIQQHSEPNGKLVSDGKNFLKVAVQNGFLNLKEVQLQGKKRMTIDAFLRGVQLEQFEVSFL